MERDWKRLGRKLAEARGDLTQVEVAAALGVSRGPIQAIERGHTDGKPPKKVSSTMRSYARLVGWADGSIERVLNGGEPETPAPATSPAEVPGSTESERPAVQLRDLPFEIREGLGEGQLLATKVMDLSPLGSKARVIMVVRGEPDATDDDLRRDLLAWEKAQLRLRGITDDESGPPAASNE